MRIVNIMRILHILMAGRGGDGNIFEIFQGHFDLC